MEQEHCIYHDSGDDLAGNPEFTFCFGHSRNDAVGDMNPPYAIPT